MSWITTLATSWGACLVAGAAVAYYTERQRALLAGGLSLAIGAAIAYGVHATVMPTQDVTWSIVAVGDAAFFAGLSSYLGGWSDGSGEEIW